MAKSIKMNAFTGMNNVKASGNLFVQKGGVVEPRILLNADATAGGRIVKRDGQTKIIDLADGHSEWAGATCHLVMDGTALQRIDGGTATTIQNCGALRAPMYYAEIGTRVYLSNKYFNGIFDPETNTVSSWGITLPVGPVLSTTSGGLPAGTYHVCFTQKSGDDISGNGPISPITLTSEGGISIGNRPDGAVVWCTDPNGDIFYRISETDTIVHVPTVEPLPSLFCSPPPYMEFITHAFGRMWGMVGSRLYYSEPLHPDWFKPGDNFFDYATNGTLIAKTKTGLFVGCEDRTHFLMGTEPDQMRQFDVGVGAVPGTLTYCNNIRELGDTISPPERTHESVPVWVSQTGIVAGNPSGRLFSLSQGKVRFSPGNRGASLYRNKNGGFHFLTSFPSGTEESSCGLSDDVTVTVMRNGKVI